MMTHRQQGRKQIRFYEGDFYKEISEQKRIARGAIHRKGGSKSRKCSMSTDYMTQKQWKERNGPIMTYVMNEPIAWESFKQMPKDLQEQYIKNLIDKYNVSYTNLVELFQVCTTTIRRYFEKQGINPGFYAGHRMNAQQKEVWAEFLGIEESETVESEESETVESKEAVTDACDESIEEPVDAEDTDEEIESVNTEVSDTSCVMGRFSVEFKGKIDVDMIANSLRMILGNNSNGRLRVEYYAPVKDSTDDFPF